MHLSKARWLGAAIISAAISLCIIPAGAGEKDSGGKNPQPVTIGVVLPMTGSVAAYGQMTWDGIRVARILRPTVLGRPVELKLVDNKSDNVEAANAASRLIKGDRVAAILGPATSSRALAAAPIAESSLVPMVLPVATNPIINQGKKFIFRVCFTDSFQGEAAARYAFRQLKAKKAAVLIDVAQDYCVALAGFFMKEFSKEGGQIVAQAKCSTGDQDFSAQLGNIRESGADVLYLPNYYTENALVARQAKELGINLPLLSGDGSQAPELIKIGGPAVEGLSLTAHFHPDGVATPVGKEFVRAYKEAQKAGDLKEDVTGFHALAADAYLLLMDALERAGATEGPRIREALSNTKGFQGVTGTINIDENGNAVKSITVLTVKDGKFAFVTTLEP